MLQFYYTFGSPSTGNYSSTVAFEAAASRFGAMQPTNALVFAALPLAGAAAMPNGATRSGSALRTTSLTTSAARGLLAAAGSTYAQARARSTIMTVSNTPRERPGAAHVVDQLPLKHQRHHRSWPPRSVGLGAAQRRQCSPL